MENLDKKKMKIVGEVVQELNDNYYFYETCLIHKLVSHIEIIPELDGKHKQRYLNMN